MIHYLLFSSIIYNLMKYFASNSSDLYHWQQLYLSYTSWTNLRGLRMGIYRNHFATLSVRLSVQIRVTARKFFFALTSTYHIWHMGVSPWDYVTHTFMVPIRTFTFMEFLTWNYKVILLQYIQQSKLCMYEEIYIKV